MKPQQGFIQIKTTGRVLIGPKTLLTRIDAFSLWCLHQVHAASLIPLP